jgi:isopenicillin N synthase-like dioxygenase
MEELAGRLMNIFEAALTLPKGWFADKFDRHTSYLSANCYPPQPVPPPPGRVRRGEHTDIGSLTILYQDGVGGLQVFDRSGVWCDVPPIEGSYVINLGDMLAKWTNDRWVATEHRVVNPPAEKAAVERISIPFFQHPNFDALIECIPSCTSPENPPKYPAVLAGDWSKFRMSLSTP